MVSSMSPSLFVDASGDIRLVVGGAGGSRITTATALVSHRPGNTTQPTVLGVRDKMMRVSKNDVHSWKVTYNLRMCAVVNDAVISQVSFFHGTLMYFHITWCADQICWLEMHIFSE